MVIIFLRKLLSFPNLLMAASSSATTVSQSSNLPFFVAGLPSRTEIMQFLSSIIAIGVLEVAVIN